MSCSHRCGFWLRPAGLVLLCLWLTLSIGAAEDDPAEAQAAGRGIRMQFDAVPYPTVIQRFAERAGMTLVGPVPLSGNLTFSDDRDYSFDEAMDLLNVLIAPQKHLLVESDGILRVVSAGQAADLPVRGVEALDAGPETREQEVVTFNQPLQFLDVQSAVRAVQAMVAAPGTVTPMVKTNSVVLTGRRQRVRQIAEILRQMDIQPLKGTIRQFQLQHADARRLAVVLGQLFGVRVATDQQQAGRAATPTPTDLPVNLTVEGQPAAGEGVGWVAQNALTITVDARTNSILVGGSDHYVTLAAQVIEKLDSDATEERVTRIYRPRNAQALNIQTAIRAFLDAQRQQLTETLSAERLGSAVRLLELEVAVVAEEASNTLLISAHPRYYAQIEKLVRDLDQAPPQVLVQVVLAQVELGDELDVGFEWQFVDDLSGDLAGSVLDASTDFGVASATGGLALSVTGDNLEMFFRALRSKGNLEILSRPQVLASDNQEATINVGQRVPFVVSSRVTDDGGLFNTIQYEDVGVILRVTPRISPDDFVRMEINPEISSIAESTVQVSEGVDAIVVNNTSATTTVTVANGQTIIIGGLIRTDESNRVRSIPLLGDIPWAGQLFKRTEIEKTRTELVIIMTPFVLRSPEDARAVTEREMDASQVAPTMRRMIHPELPDDEAAKP